MSIMHAEALEIIRFDRYARIAENFFSGLESFKVFDSGDKEIYSFARTRHLPETDSADEIALRADLGSKRYEISNSGDFLYYVGNILALQNESYGTVYIKVKQPKGIMDESLSLFFWDIMDCISEELNLNLELNDMATDLAGKYEQHNLLFSSLHAEAENKEDGTLHDEMNKVVHECHQYMSLDYAGICFPEKNLEAEMGQIQSINPSVLNLKHLATLCFPYLQENRASLVFNQPSDVLQTPLEDSSLQSRLIMVPVFLDHLEIVGFFCVARSFDTPEFTNNDRQLIEMLSRSASRIIQKYYDAATGLLNRAAFEDYACRLVESWPPQDQPLVMAVININYLSIVNDTCGQRVGDRLIKLLGSIIELEIKAYVSDRRNMDFDQFICARLGGDDFALIMKGLSLAQSEEVVRLISRKVDSYNNSMPHLPSNCNFNIRAGLAKKDPGVPDFNEWLSLANLACSFAKQQVGDHIYVYRDDDRKLLQERNDIYLFARVRNAPEQGRLTLFCQEIRSLKGGAPHFEILSRVQEDDGSLISPVEFIHAAERFGLMMQIDEWVVRETFSKLAVYRNQLDPLQIIWSINLSGQSISYRKFFDYIESQLEHFGLDPRKICFEITETSTIGYFEAALEFIKKLRGLGCKFSLDDFGSGLSSFNYLKEIPVDYLKIDGSFITHIAKDHISEKMVAAIHGVGETMGLETIAEFVEDETTMHILEKIGLDFVQGFGIHYPEPVDDVLKRLISKGGV